MKKMDERRGLRADGLGRFFKLRAAGCGFLVAWALVIHAPAAVVKLSGEPEFSGGYPSVDDEFFLTPDGSRVVFEGILTTDGVLDIYSVPLDGSGPRIQLTDASTSSTHITNVVMSPDGSRVFFARWRAEIGEGGFNEYPSDLFSVPVATAGAETALAQNILRWELQGMQVTPDGNRVVYWGEPASTVGDGVFSTSAKAASAPVQISDNPADGYVRQLSVVQTPSGARAVYLANFSTYSINQVYSASVDAAGTQLRLNSDPVSGGAVDDDDDAPLAFTADGSRVLYTGDLLTNNKTELYSASTTAAGAQFTVSQSAIAQSDVLGFLLYPGGAQALYPGDLVSDEVYSLYRASTTTPGTQAAVYDLSTFFAGVSEIRITPDAAHLILVGDLTTPGVDELYTAPTTFTSDPVRLTGLSAGEDVGAFQISPDGSFIVYRVDEPTGFSLWAVDASGAYAPVRILPEAGESWAYIGRFQIRSGGQSVVFTGHHDVDDPSLALYAADVPDLTSGTNPNGGSSTPSRPTIAVSGKKKIKTDGKRVKIKGTAADDSRVVRVEARYKKVSASGKKKKVVASAKLSGGSWTFKLRPKAKRTKVQFRAIDDKGLASPFVKVTVMVKP